MDFLAHLWLPILASAVAVWFASALFWMAIGHHKKDTKPLTNEQEFMETMKRWNLPPGNYGFPDFGSCDGMSRQERKAKWEQMTKNPMGFLRVWAPMSMGRNMLLTFLFYLLTSTVIACLAWPILPHTVSAINPGADHSMFAHVFHTTGLAAILAYCFASVPNDIWFQKSRRAMLTNFIDGVVFGLITGAIFAWLWPRS